MYDGMAADHSPCLRASAAAVYAERQPLSVTHSADETAYAVCGATYCKC